MSRSDHQLRWPRLAFELDWLAHQPARLVMMMAFAERPRSFTEIVKLMDVNEGLITYHARYLESVGYVHRTVKTTTGQRHRTIYELTSDGFEALESYRDMTGAIASELGRVCKGHLT